MTCPYRREITMVFCRAYPVKKLVPSDHLDVDSACESEGFKTCPLYREALQREEPEGAASHPTPGDPKGATP